MNARVFEAAQGWDFERSAALTFRNRWLTRLLALVSAIAMLEAVALALQPALRTVQPPTILTQDPETHGYTITHTLEGLDLSQDEALSEMNLTRYIIARETWDPAAGRVNVELGQQNNRLVYAYSTPEVWQEYAPLNMRGAPGNRFDLYGDNLVSVAIKSISFLGPEQAQVRFSTMHQGITEHWIATVGFTYVDPPSDFRARQQNPIGFIVTHYRRDQEVIHAERN